MRRLDGSIDAGRRALARAAPVAHRGTDRARDLLSTPRGRAAAVVVLGALVLLVVIAVPGGEHDAEAPGERAAGADRMQSMPGVPRQVSDVLDQMTLEQKVGQLLLVGLEGTGTDDPVLSTLEEAGYGGVVIAERNHVSTRQVEDLADAAVSTAEDADQVTPWVMAPQEGGEFNAFPDVPPDESAAEVRSTAEAFDQARESGEALLDLGVTGVLGPVVDVGPLAGGALGERIYSDITREVTGYAIATVDAYKRAGIFAAAKHFPGLGSASQSTELGPANVGLTLEQLAERDLIPFQAAIEAGVPGIVVGHGLYGVEDFVTPASTSKTILQDVLRRQLDFDGVAIADDVTAPGITATFRSTAAAVDAVRAGADMVYVSQDDDLQQTVHEALLDAVRDDEITNRRLNEAVARTLVAKRDAGVLERPEPPEGERRAEGGDAGKGGEEADGETGEGGDAGPDEGDEAGDAAPDETGARGEPGDVAPDGGSAEGDDDAPEPVTPFKGDR